MKLPPRINSIGALIEAHHESSRERPRPHMGASVLGHSCERWLWLSFRWAAIEQFSGRMLRLFDRGKREEDVVLANLRAIGMEIDGTQDRVDFGCHISGSTDGVIKSGVPDAPKTAHVLEIKTHSKKSFDELVAKGVKAAKPMHWAQMQVYMKGLGLTRALYFAVCKNDDAIHTERIEYDADAANILVERGKRIVLNPRPPAKISENTTWWECKFCAAHDLCHGSRMTKEVNCRTCAFSTPNEKTEWICERHDQAIPVDYQREGCPSHVLHPDLVPWKMGESFNQAEAVYIIDGEPTRNGEGDAFTLSSVYLIEKYGAK